MFCAEVFDIMLTYIYTDELPRLGSKWLTSAGVEHLLEAADLHLLLGMKVRGRHLAPALLLIRAFEMCSTALSLVTAWVEA